MIVAYRCERKDHEGNYGPGGLVGIVEAENSAHAAHLIVKDIEEDNFKLKDYIETISVVVNGECTDDGFEVSDYIEQLVIRIAFERGIVDKEGVLL